MTQSVEAGSELGLPSPKERRRLRESVGLTHEEVAAAVGVTASTVRSWETGRTDPRGRKREAYARFLAALASASKGAHTTAGARPRSGAKRAAKPSHRPKPDAPSAPVTPTPPDDPPAAGAAAPAKATAASTTPEVEADPEAKADATTAPDPGAPHPVHIDAPPPPAPGGPTPAEAGAPRPGDVATPPPAEPITDTPAPATTGPAEADDTADTPSSATDTSGAATPPPAEPITDTPAPATTGPTEAADTPGSATDAGGVDTLPPAAPATTRPVEADDTADTPGSATDASGAATPPPAEPITGTPADIDTDSAAGPTEAPAPGRSGPEQAFDALYARAAPALTRQAYLLTGRRGLAQEAVERAFQQAWARWPEVSADPDPVGWVRAAAHEYALSPWHRFRRAHRHPDKPPAEPADRILLDALLALPTPHRRTVLLYDGVGLGLPDTAAETEASTPTTGGRLLHAHADLAGRLPELADVPAEKQSALLRTRLAGLRPAVRLEPRPPAVVRRAEERRTRRLTRAAVGLTAVIAVAAGYTAVTAPTQYEPPQAPGESVSGVPPHSGPQRLTDQSRQLHDKLRLDPSAGPARLTPLME